MLKNNIFRLIKLVSMCLILFFLFDTFSVLLVSLLMYLKIKEFLFSWQDVFCSFIQTGYIGGLLLGAGIWIKIKIHEYKITKNNKCN